MMAMNAQMAAENAAGIVNNQPKPGDPCSLDDGSQGTLQFNANSELVCVALSIVGITIRPILEEPPVEAVPAPAPVTVQPAFAAPKGK